MANAPPISPNSYAAEAAQLRAANAELTLRLTESEAVQEQLQAMLRKTATQLKAAVTSVRFLSPSLWKPVSVREVCCLCGTFLLFEFMRGGGHSCCNILLFTL